MKKKWIASSLLYLFIFYTAVKAEAANKIQIAILLDTSNSMDGLIEQAKSQLWKIVNKLALAKYKGEQPTLEIALYEYGNNSLSPEKGYIRQVAFLTTDLDKISEELFKLKTNGGDEYCGQVIQTAINELKWSSSNQDLKLIYIAGNEPFTQGKVNYIDACKNAIKKSIVVNTIFCGNETEGIQTKWKDGADLADGSYMNINQNIVTAYINTPYDDTLSFLNTQLNNTYIGYGSLGTYKKEAQAAQDQNAATYGKANVAERAASKSSAVYRNSEWDLVDAVKEKDVKLSEVKAEDLPDNMKNMTLKEREEYIEQKTEEREKVQKQIQEVNQKRQEYIAIKQKENSEQATLDNALLKTIQEQAQKKNYTFNQ